MEVLWRCSGDAVEVLRRYSGGALEMLWSCYEDAVEVLWR